MKNTDEMSLLCALYNKTLEKFEGAPMQKIKKSFTEKSKYWVEQYEISPETEKYAINFLFENGNILDGKSNGYFSSANAREKAEAIVAEVFGEYPPKKPAHKKVDTYYVNELTKMNKAEEMMVLCAIYNRLSEQHNNDLEQTNKAFIKSCDKLIAKQEISEQVANFARVFLIEEERKKIQPGLFGFSNDDNRKKAEELIDKIIDDERDPETPAKPSTTKKSQPIPTYRPSTTSRTADPCSSGSYNRSPC